MSDVLPVSDYFNDLAYSYGNALLSDDDYPAVLIEIDDGERIAVNKDGTRYHFQKRLFGKDGRPYWVAASCGGYGDAPSGGYASKTTFLKKNPGLLSYPEVEAIPSKPKDALARFSDLSDGRRAYLMRIRMNDEKRDDYAGVIIRDVNARLALHHDGAEYLLQMFAPPGDLYLYPHEWKTLCRSRFLSELSEFAPRFIRPNDDGDLAPDIFQYFETGINDATENPWLELVGLPYLTRLAPPQNGDGSTEG